jgi:hypothetical protein
MIFVELPGGQVMASVAMIQAKDLDPAANSIHK